MGARILVIVIFEDDHPLERPAVHRSKRNTEAQLPFHPGRWPTMLQSLEDDPSKSPLDSVHQLEGIMRGERDDSSATVHVLRGSTYPEGEARLEDFTASSRDSM